MLPPGSERLPIETQKTHKTGVTGAAFNFVCSTVGAGIVSLPGAIQAGGWIAVLMIVVLGSLASYTAWLIGQCMVGAVEGRALRTYAEIGQEAFHKVFGESKQWIGRLIVIILQLITLFGVCTVFLILAGTNMASLTGVLTDHDWIFIFGALLIPVAWLKTMKEILPVAIFGVVASIFVGAVISVEGIIHGSTNSNVNYDIVVWEGLPVAFNVIVFSFGGHSVLPTIHHSLKKPYKNWKPFIVISYTTITAIYVEVAMNGYAGWGDKTNGNVLVNLGDSIIGQISTAAITLHVLLAFPIPLNPISLYLEAALGTDDLPPKKELVSRIVLRTCVVLLIVFIASIVPYFSQVLSLVSAFSTISMVFICPVAFYWMLRKDHVSKSLLLQIFLVFLLLVGILSTIAGSYYGILDLIDEINAHPSPFSHFFSNH